MGILSDRIISEMASLTDQSQRLDKQYSAAKKAVESRIGFLGQLLPKVTPELEALIVALGIPVDQIGR